MESSSVLSWSATSLGAGTPLTLSFAGTVVPGPSPSPTSTEPPTPAPTSAPAPTPEPTVTITQTVTAQPSGPQAVTLDGEQFAGITLGLVLLLVLVAALLISQMRRP